MGKYRDGVTRLNVLRRICPEFDEICKSMNFGTFRKENPPLSIACSIYNATYCANPSELILELYARKAEPDEEYIPDVCKHLARLFAESNEPECTMALLRWVKENGYTEAAETPFRL